MSTPSRALREGQTIPGAGRLAVYSNLVKLPHTVFALPFALVGVVLASHRHPVGAWEVAWVLVAFTAARFAAMGFNRIVDRELDARNPRTAGREIPAGRLTVGRAGAAVAGASVLFMVAAGMLNPLCLLLAPPALGWVFLYSYTKRFTRWSHLVLGGALAIAPVGGYLAVAGTWSEPPGMLLLLAGAVLCWVAGFDILYSLQDADVDRREGLHSIPATLGVSGALVLSRTLHAGSAGLFLAVGLVLPETGWLYLAAAGLIAVMLAYEQALVRADDLSRIDAAFFTVNGAISIVFFGLVLLERLLT